MSALDTRVPPVVWTLAAAGAQAAIVAAGRGRKRPVAPGFRRLAGALLAGNAVGFGVAGIAGFRRRGTTISPDALRESSQLVTDGAHSVSRNPMYLGLGLGLGAVAVWTGRPAALLPALGAVAAIDRFQVGPEERILLELFGPDYEVYRAAVPRWVDGRTPDLLLRAVDDATIGPTAG